MVSSTVLKSIQKHLAYRIFLRAVCSSVGGRGRFMHNPLRLLSNDLDARSSQLSLAMKRKESELPDLP